MRKVATAACAAGLLLLGASVTSTHASATGRLRWEKPEGVVGLDAARLPQALDLNATVMATVQLGGAPVAAVVGDAKLLGRDLSDQEKAQTASALAASQDALRAAIVANGGTVVNQMQYALNGIVVSIPRRGLAALRALPGVTAVQEAVKVERDNTNSNTFNGVPIVWQSLGLLGQGMKVGIIDTGIDYTHADFGGPGTVAAYTSNDPTVIEPGTFPTAKVMGGYDFVGDAYNADGSAANRIPKPDADPLDCNEHGTHVAGTAAGFGVTAAGDTFTGPYDAATVAGLRIGPGAAPKASLYAYKVFGCVGSVNDPIIVAAVDRAVKDGMDVINLSLGSSFGDGQSLDSQALNNASRAGVMVVASAGNSGPNAYIVGNPGAADRPLAVAAQDAIASFPGATLSIGAGISAINANNGGPLPVTAPVLVLKNAAGGIALGCTAFPAAAAGKIVVTARGTCARVQRAVNGQAAGAVAVVMVNNASGYPPFEGDIPGVTIPFLGVDKASAAAIVAADGTTITVTATTLANPTYKFAASFSSGGPRYGDSGMKPDIEAPGVSIISAGIGSGNGFGTLSGTSMASPHTAGIAALVRQAHPGWNPAMIKAALMNTADATTAKTAGYNPRVVGSGAVDAPAAVSTKAVAFTEDGKDNLSFGYQAAGRAVSQTIPFKLANRGKTSVTYDLAAQFTGSSLGAAVTVSPATVTVRAGEDADLEATLSISAASVAALHGASGLPNGAVVTVRGAVIATPRVTSTGVSSLRVPFLVAPRGTSSVSAKATGKSTVTAASASRTIAVKNVGNHAGTADVYAWQLSDPTGDAPGSGIDLTAAGVQVLPGAALGSTPDDRSIIFAVNQAASVSTVAANEYDVAIDVNHDGAPDFFVFAADLGNVTAGAVDGRAAVFTVNAHTGRLLDAYLLDVMTNASTIELPTLASDLGLTPGTPFEYSVVAFDRSGAIDDIAATAAFDPFNPAVSTGDFIDLPAGASDSFVASVARGQLASTPVKGWLVVSVDDAGGTAQADRIELGDVTG